MTNPEGHFITLPSEPMSSSGILPSLIVSFVIIFIIGKMCAPLGMGGLGTQPLEVSKTFCTPGHLELLLTQGTIMLNCGNVLLELANPCISGGDFLVISSKAIELGRDPPVFKSSCVLQ
jgi:hypothetical protein